MVACNGENHYATNVGAVLGQIATGGGASHLEEQLACTFVPSLSKKVLLIWNVHWAHYLKQWLANSCYLKENKRDS